MTKPAKANMYDVAKLAGVSHQTVSRVVNGHDSIRAATRDKVEQAMAQLDYRPNAAARALATRKSNMLGILVSDTGLYGPAGMLYAMEHEARNSGYYTVSIAVQFDDEKSWADGIAHLGRLGVEGLAIIALPKGAMQLVVEQFPNLPMVAIDTENFSEVTGVGIDNFEGGYRATRHLIDMGHRSIVHIAGPEESAEAQARLAGYEKAVIEQGLPVQVIQGDWSAETGHNIGLNVDLESSESSAIFAANDHLCLGLLKAFRTRGIDVPGKVSLVGFDDIPESPYFNPPLTTIRQDFDQLGASAMQILLDEISGEIVSKRVSVHTELILRESTAKRG